MLFEDLCAWIEEKGGTVGSRVELKEINSSRTLTSKKEFQIGEAIVRIPWCLAINLKTALKRLSADQKLEKPVTKLGLGHFVHYVRESGAPDSPSSLLVALQVLSEGLDQTANLFQYTKLLPSPEALGTTLGKLVHGPRMVHPLLFCRADLDQLQNDTLKASIEREQEMLRKIHKNALCGEHVSFEEWKWAVAIVRSRSLNLSLHHKSVPQQEQENGEGESLQCMLPMIDMCDHSAHANCSLRCCLSDGDGSVNAIELVAQSTIHAGEGLTIDYGHRGLRDFFRVYGFVPAEEECRSEVFEDASNPLEAIFVNGHRGGRFFSLGKIVVVPSLLAQLSCHPATREQAANESKNEDNDDGDDILQKALLETSLLLDAEGCSCLYEIEDESSCTIDSFKECPRVLGAKNALCSLPGQEEKALERVIDYCSCLAEHWPTTLEEDMKEASFDRKELASRDGNLHAILAYRIARKSLLHKVVDDLKVTRQAICLH